MKKKITVCVDDFIIDGIEYLMRQYEFSQDFRGFKMSRSDIIAEAVANYVSRFRQYEGTQTMNAKPIFKNGTMATVSIPSYMQPHELFEVLYHHIGQYGPIYSLTYAEDRKREITHLAIYSCKAIQPTTGQKMNKWETDLPFIKVAPFLRMLKVILRTNGPLLAFALSQDKDISILKAYSNAEPWDPEAIR